MLFAALIGLAGYLLRDQENLISPHFFTVYGFFVVLTCVVFGFAYFASRIKSQQNSLQLILFSFLFRLICSFLFFVIITSFTKDYSLLFTGNFFVLYLLFTVFEIYYLVAILRADFKNT